MEQILFTTKEQESLKAWMDDHGEVGQLILREQPVAPDLSEPGHAVMYWDAALDVMLCSVDGAPFVECVAAAAGPGSPVGSTQFNDNGAFGGGTPIHVAAFDGGLASGTAIQDAITAAVDGQMIQLEAVAYDVSDVVSIVVDKAITIQGTNLGMSYTPDQAPTLNSQITGGVGQTIFTVTTGKAVVFRDLSFVNGVGGIGITLGAGTVVNGISKIERCAFYFGAKGIYGVPGMTLGTTVQDCYFHVPTEAGMHFGGYSNPNAGFTNCDGGGYTISNNYLFGDHAVGMLFDNSAAVSMLSNQGTGFDHMLHLRIGFPTPCVGPGPTQWQIRGNQFDLNGRTGPTVFIEAQYGTGAYEIVGNFFGGTASVGSNVVQVDITPVIGFMFGFIFANNNVGGGTGKALEITGPIVDANISDNSMAFGSFNVTGDTTLGSPIVTNLNLDTSYFSIGMTVGAPIFPVPTTILSIDSPTQITLTEDATATIVAEGLSISGQPVLTIDTPVYGVLVTNNTVPNPIDGHKLWDCDGCTIISPYNRGFSQNLSTLPAALDGSEMWCSDCGRTQPCVSVGAFAGANARRQDGTWICLDQTPTWTSAGIKESNTALQNREYLLALIAALPVSGGRIELPSGSMTIDNTTPIEIDKAVIIEGAIQASPSGSLLLPTDGTQDLFLVTAPFGVQFRHLTIQQPGSTTTGAFIHFDGSAGANVLSLVDDVTFVGCFTCIDIENAKQWQITNSNFLTTIDAGAVAILQRSTDPSFGGGVVSHCAFGNGSSLGTAVMITSGAHFNIHDNFFFQMANHVVVDWTPALGGVIGFIEKNIFEGGSLATDGVSLRTQGGGGTFFDLIIANNAFSDFLAASISSTAGALYEHVSVTGNTLPVGSGTIGVDTGVGSMSIVSNLFSGNGAATGVNIQAAALRTHVEANEFVGTWTSEIVDAGTDSTLSLNAFGADLVIPSLASPNEFLTTDAAGVLTTAAVSGGSGITSLLTTAPITGGPITTSGTIGIDDFVASGASHARGSVPDPGAVAGTTKFLREDATWQVPAGGGTITGSGATTRLAVWDSTSDITGFGDFTWDDTNQRLLVGNGFGSTGAVTGFGSALLDMIGATTLADSVALQATVQTAFIGFGGTHDTDTSIFDIGFTNDYTGCTTCFGLGHTMTLAGSNQFAIGDSIVFTGAGGSSAALGVTLNDGGFDGVTMVGSGYTADRSSVAALAFGTAAVLAEAGRVTLTTGSVPPEVSVETFRFFIGAGTEVDQGMGLTTRSGGLQNNAVLASRTTAINGTANNIVDSGTFATHDSSIVGGAVNAIQGAAIVASGTGTITGADRSALVATVGSSIGDSTVNSAIMGASSGSIGASNSTSVILGGIGGSVAAGVTGGVSLAGGTVTNSFTTVVGGTAFSTPGMIDIKVFGAVGNGTNDDTAEIQAVIDAAELSGAEVFCSPGTYKVSAALTVTQPLVFRGTRGLAPSTLTGCIIIASNATQDIFNVSLPNTTSNPPYDFDGGAFVLEDVTLGASVVKTAGAGVFITNAGASCSGAILDKVAILDQWDGVNSDKACGVTIVNSRIAKWRNRGIHLENQSAVDGGSYRISGNYIFSLLGGAAIEWHSGGDMQITGNAIGTLGPYGIDITATNSGGGPSVATSMISVTGNEIESPSSAALNISAAAGQALTRVTATGNMMTCSGSGCSGIRTSEVTIGSVNQITMTGNVVSADNCFDVAGGDAVMISGNTCSTSWNGISVSAAALNVSAGENYIVAGSKVFNISNTTTSILTARPVTLTSLPTAADGTRIWCSNCDPTATLLTCTSVGAATGAMAVRTAGTWKCIG